MKASEIRQLIPVLGLQEYWYPALKTGMVGKRPKGLRIMGKDLVLFRGKSGDIVALDNACPHRGGSLAHGDCHYAGTVACPYHGWVFDEEGVCVAVLSEGPDSRIPRKRVSVRKYPTQCVRDMIFIWMGEGDPVPIEDDVPPEFFEDRGTMVFTAITYWPINWRVALENSLDSHVVYVHRNSLMMLREPIVQFGPVGNRPRFVNESAAIGYMTTIPKEGAEYYPALNAHWPKTNWRRLWLWLFRSLRNSATKLWSNYPPFNNDEEWDMHTFIDGTRARAGGHHLPSMFRFDFGTHMLTRACVPVDEEMTRIVYYHAVRPKTALGRLFEFVHYYGFYRWAMYFDFSKQDYRVMKPQRYDLPEVLSATDAQIVAWRKLLLRARGMKSDTTAVEEEEDEVSEVKPAAAAE